MIVFGGRFNTDYDHFSRVIMKFDPSVIIHGGSTGTDALASRFCKEYVVREESIPADFSIGGIGGPAGNIQLIELAKRMDVHFASGFSGGKGTANMQSLLTKNNFTWIMHRTNSILHDKESTKIIDPLGNVVFEHNGVVDIPLKLRLDIEDVRYFLPHADIRLSEKGFKVHGVEFEKIGRAHV